MTKEKGDKKGRVFWREALILTVCILLQLVNLIYWGCQKGGYYGDELYSYGFVSSVDYPSINEDRPGEKYLDNWHDSGYFRDYLTVSDEEAFDLKGVCSSIQQDVHPPLFYLFLHIFCSIFRNRFTKWAGLSLNLIFFVLSMLVLYQIGCELFHSCVRFFPLILYGFSAGATGTVMLIRMYMMLTFFILLFCYFHIRLWKHLKDGGRAERGKDYAGIFLAVVAGVLTQYYFVIFAFFLCIVIWIYQIRQKKYQIAAAYALVMGSGLTVSFLLWPAMYQQIFVGYRGREAFEGIASSWEHFAKNLSVFLEKISSGLFGGLTLPVLLFLVFLAAGTGLKGVRDEKKGAWYGMVWADFTFAALMYVLLVAKIAPYQSVRYVYPVFPVIVLSIVMAMVFCLEGVPRREIWTLAVMAGMCLMILLIYRQNGVEYLYRDTAQKLELSDQYAGFPSVLLTHKNRRKTSNYESMFFLRRQKVYPIDADGIDGLDRALEEVNGNAFILHIDRCYKKDVDAMLERVKKVTGAVSSRWLFDTSKCRVYLIER